MNLLCRLGLHHLVTTSTRPFDTDAPNGRQVTNKRCTRCSIRKGFVR